MTTKKKPPETPPERPTKKPKPMTIENRGPVSYEFDPDAVTPAIAQDVDKDLNPVGAPRLVDMNHNAAPLSHAYSPEHVVACRVCGSLRIGLAHDAPCPVDGARLEALS